MKRKRTLHYSNNFWHIMYLRCGENLAVLIKKTRKTNCNDLIAVESGFRLAPPSKD